jgi:hypothetical protein
MRKLLFVCTVLFLLPIGIKADKEKAIQTLDTPTDSSFTWNKDLDEVVVTGQGVAVSKRRLSSNITKLSSADLGSLPTGRID